MGQCLCHSNEPETKTIKPEPPPAEVEDEKAKYPFVPLDHYLEDINAIFKVQKILGEGATAKVSQALELRSGQIFALKQINNKAKGSSKKMFAREAKVLEILKNHSHILQIHATYIDDVNFYIVSKLYTGGAFFYRIKQMKHFSEKKAAEYVKTIIETIKYIHDRNIAHRDLKPENIVLSDTSENAQLVIIDFGEAIQIDDEKQIFSDVVGTPLYLSPEIIRKREAWELKTSDMWTIGVIAFILVTGTAPFIGPDLSSIVNKICAGKYDYPKNINLSNECKDFIHNLLQQDTKKRYNASQGLNHQWLKTNVDDHLGDDIIQRIGDFANANMLQKLIIGKQIKYLTQDQKQIVEDEFKKMDVRGQGYIVAQDITDYYMKSGIDSNTAKQKATETMQIMDPNKTGKITLNDYTRSQQIAKLTRATTQYLHDEFLKIKPTAVANGDQITANVFVNYFQQESIFTDDDIDQLIDELPVNDKGKVEFEDFKILVRNKTE